MTDAQIKADLNFIFADFPSVSVDISGHTFPGYLSPVRTDEIKSVLGEFTDVVMTIIVRAADLPSIPAKGVRASVNGTSYRVDSATATIGTVTINLAPLSKVN